MDYNVKAALSLVNLIILDQYVSILGYDALKVMGVSTSERTASFSCNRSVA